MPRADHELDFSYQFRGQTLAARDFLERTYTNALLVMKDGRIVYENYRNSTNESTRFIGFSMTKSINSVLIGCALEEKRIRSIDDPITRYLPELAGGGYNGVTIRQILQMRSGVDYEERYDFEHPGIAARSHEQALVRNVVRFADVARTVQRKHPPGAVWEYKTLDTAVLGWLLERVSGGSTVAAYTAQRLWEPLGAEMVIGGGVANGHRIVSREWIAESTRPTGGPGPGYGYQWWMGLRPGSFQAVGLQGQYIYIDPASRTVIVKLSYFPPGDEDPDEESAAFFAAASAWTPR